MIENRKQLEITRKWIDTFKESKSQIEKEVDIPELHRHLYVSSFDSILAELEIDVEVYLKNNPG